MKEKIKKMLLQMIARRGIKCIFNHICDYALMYIARLYPAHTIAVHILMTNPYSMIILHFCLFKTFVIIINIVKQICIMYKKK